MKQHKPLLSPTNDVVFKLIFSDKKNSDILVDFLSGATGLPPEDFEEIYLVDPHLRREDEHDKLGILDIKVKTKSGKTIDIEIQVCSQAWLRERLVYYLSKMITEQVGSGDSYQKIKKAIIIIITDFVFIKDSPRCHNRYQLRDESGASLFSDVVEINTLELPKARKGRSRGGVGCGSGRDGMSVGDGMGNDIEPDSKLAGWLMFFNTRDGNEEELMIAAEKNPKIKKARAILVKLSEDERTRMLAEAEEKARWDREAYLLTAQMEGHASGHAKGLAEGREAGRTEGAASVMSLLDAGVPLDEIRRRLGL